MSFQSLLEAALNEDDLLQDTQDQNYCIVNGGRDSMGAARKETIANSDQHSDIEMETASESAHESNEDSSYEEEEEDDDEEEDDSDVERQVNAPYLL